MLSRNLHFWLQTKILIKVLLLFSGQITSMDGRTVGWSWRTTRWATTSLRMRRSTAAGVPSAWARLSSLWVSMSLHYKAALFLSVRLSPVSRTLLTCSSLFLNAAVSLCNIGLFKTSYKNERCRLCKTARCANREEPSVAVWASRQQNLLRHTSTAVRDLRGHAVNLYLNCKCGHRPPVWLLTCSFSPFAVLLRFNPPFGKSRAAGRCGVQAFWLHALSNHSGYISPRPMMCFVAYEWKRSDWQMSHTEERNNPKPLYCLRGYRRTS